jgi:gliding motility-associated-like protein
MAQELVYNGGFEEHYCLPTKISDILCCKGWNEVNWIPDGQPPHGTPDYYIDSATYNLTSIEATDCKVQTHNGAATMRIGTFRSKENDYREYLATHLLEPLKPGAFYRLTFWVNNGEAFPFGSNVGYSCTGLGAVFSTERLTAVPHDVINRKPKVEFNERIWVNEWTQYRFDFQADSAYEYMTIGFFRNDANIECIDQLAHQSTVPENRSGYYFFDDISLVQKEGVYGDTVICYGETAQLNAFYRTGSYTWIDASNPDTVLSTASQVQVSPEETSSYVVYTNHRRDTLNVRVVHDTVDLLPADTTICKGEVLQLTVPFRMGSIQWYNGSSVPMHHIGESGMYWLNIYDHHCAISDTIFVEAELCECDPLIPNAFSPDNDGLNDVFLPLFDCPLAAYRLQLFSRWGEIVFETSRAELGWDGRIKNKEAAAGVYVYLMEYTLHDGSVGKRSGTLTLMR